MKTIYFAQGKSRFILALLGLCAAFICISVMSVKDDSNAFDEAIHIPAGFAALKEQNFIINLEHPPLLKMIAAVPLLFQKINYKTNYTTAGPDYELLAIASFYPLNKKNYDTILFSARVATIVFNTFLLFILGMLLRQIISPVLALLGIFFIAFEPNFLAHARYITTDVGVDLFSLLSIVTLSIYLKKGKNAYLWLTALFLGAALLSKFSAVLTYLFISVLFVSIELPHIFKTHGMKTFKKITPNLALILIAPWVIVYLVYFGTSLNLNTDQLNFKTRLEFQATAPTMSSNVFLRPLLLYQIGIHHVSVRFRLGHEQSSLPQYLNGEVRLDKGWRQYFLFALLYKETPVLLVLFALSLILFQYKRADLLEKMLMAFSLMYLFMSLKSDLNIGIRHILSLITTLTLLSVLILSRQQFWLKFKLWYVAIAFQVFSLISIYPYYLGYFNVIAGGPANGYKHLIDSNLDWGQNLNRLHLWAKKNKIDSMTVFSWFEPYSDFFDDGNVFKRELPVAADGKPKGYLAVSIMASLLSKEGKNFLPKNFEYLNRTYLQNMRPVAVVAHTYRVYYFP